MKKNMNERLYKQIMESMGSIVKQALNEEFEAPKMTVKEKLFGMTKSYNERVAKAEEEYYADHRTKFVNALQKADSLETLLKISRGMMADGFKFPVSGMLSSGVVPARATLADIHWMSYDRETSFPASTLAKIETKTGVNDLVVYTYYFSWKWWCGNILRCLFFWKEPYGEKADKGISELTKEYAPKCPIIKIYPDYFKKNA